MKKERAKHYKRQIPWPSSVTRIPFSAHPGANVHMEMSRLGLMRACSLFICLAELKKTKGSKTSWGKKNQGIVFSHRLRDTRTGARNGVWRGEAEMMKNQESNYFIATILNVIVVLKATWKYKYKWKFGVNWEETVLKLRKEQERSMDGNERWTTRKWIHWGDAGLHLPSTGLCTNSPASSKQINVTIRTGSFKHKSPTSMQVQQVVQRSVN